MVLGVEQPMAFNGEGTISAERYNQLLEQQGHILLVLKHHGFAVIVYCVLNRAAFNMNYF